MSDPLSIYRPANRSRLLALAALLIVTVALVDWSTAPFISLGFLYLFPIMLVGGFLPRLQIVGVALLCAALQEAFSNLPPHDAAVRLVMSCAGFAATGLFISELVRNRRMVSRHVEELEGQARLRRDAEEQLRVLIESSPAAIVTLDEHGDILLANEAAQELLAPAGPPLPGQPIGAYLPSLQAVVQAPPSRVFRTTFQCTGERRDGEVFLAGLWFSTYTSVAGPRVAAIIVDLSEEVRGREDLSLDHLLKHARILMSAVAHEIRNLCGAVLVVHKNLSRVEALAGNEDFAALGTLIQGLEQLAGLELRPSAGANSTAVNVKSVLDEVRVLIDGAVQALQIGCEWLVPASLPLVWADRYGLVQVFLNLARNSQRAMSDTEMKQLRVVASADGENVVIRVEDTGVGIDAPETLFRPFQRGAGGATGLGLYVSRAILRSFGGDLVYEPRPRGCCFAVVLRSLRTAEEGPHA
jgi:signal transduction histidine kinase